MKTLFDGTMQLLEQALDARGRRHAVLAGNLANADTPGFTPKDLDFDGALRAASEGERVEATDAAVLSRPGGSDGNTVDVDRSLAAVTENTMQYMATARAAQKRLAILRAVVSDGLG
jgi:flagellar basal-body rod protein FlgB